LRWLLFLSVSSSSVSSRGVRWYPGSKPYKKRAAHFKMRRFIVSSAYN
jgi:hypothetical protein